MLSVCIPVYQVDVRPLVRSLQAQAAVLPIPLEIFCLDDASDPFWQRLNRELEGQDLVRYEELTENLGRARIRNRLAREAVHPYLLFLDSDARLSRPDFLERYAQELPTDAVLCGGGHYQPEPPVDSRYWLHWYYGSRVEQKPAAQRRQQPYLGFKTFNFLVPRRLLLEHPFDENLVSYGHEDTLWGMELERAGIPIRHLDNPACHAGLEPVEKFLQKQRQAIDQLLVLEGAYPRLPVRLLRWGRQLEARRLDAPVRWMVQLISPILGRMLTGHRSVVSLWALHIFKLGYLLERKAS